MLIQNTFAGSAVTTKPAHIHAPAESIEQFRALLIGMKYSLETSNPVLTTDQKPGAQPRGSLIDDTSERLNQSEVALDELNWEIRKAGQSLGKAMPMSGALPAQISYMKYATTAYFTNLMRTESGFSSLSEELQALTKKRS